jgi:hypothetical protein
MAETWTLTLEPDRYGREHVRTVNLTIDIRDFKGTAIFPWLLIAANPHLSVRDTQTVLLNVGEQNARSAGWISRRRWMCFGVGKTGSKRNADGLDDKARKIMAKNPHVSNRQLVYLLKQRGIRRSREWVRQNRVSDN